jgi:putative addiction module component (TIGR02574 family)
METSTAELLKQALALPSDARAAMAESLLASLDDGVDENAAEAWRIEVSRRAEELNSQTVQALTWSEVQARIAGLLQ